ncbi:hypothetical protein ACWDG9_26405 [Streptomyces sp. NPDC001073]
MTMWPRAPARRATTTASSSADPEMKSTLGASGPAGASATMARAS